MADKKMMFCIVCGHSQLAVATDCCCRCPGILVKAPQEHVRDFKHIGEYSGAEVQRRDDAENDKRERQTL